VQGPIIGNNSVTITGSGFAGNPPTAVAIDGTSISGFVVNTGANSITINQMPSHSMGVVAVKITFTDASTSTLNYTYTPTITGVSPASGATHGGQTITVNTDGLFVAPPSATYVTNGLQIHYDAINNTGAGDAAHSKTATTWKDLSGNGRDGTLINFASPVTATSGWGDKDLVFDGTNDWVRSVLYKPTTLTMQTVITMSLPSAASSIFGNWESGGGGLRWAANNTLGFNLYIGGAYQTASTVSSLGSTPQLVRLSGVYNGSSVKFTRDNYTATTATTGSLTYHSTTVWALGTNPNGTSASSEYFKGRFHSVRLYDRALTDSELCQNAWTDYYRFGGTAPDCYYSSGATPPYTITVNGQVCTNPQYIDYTKISCVTPESNLPGSDTVSPYRDGTVDVEITAGGATSLSASPTRNDYTYKAPMLIESVSSNFGPVGGGTEITISGHRLVPATPSEGYITDGLIVRYDGINNTGSGHSDSVSTWKNLVNNSYNGALSYTPSSGSAYLTWGANNLYFKGSDLNKFVTVGQLNPANPTIDVVMSGSANSAGTQVIASNAESGGCYLAISVTGLPFFAAYINGAYVLAIDNKSVVANQATTVSGSYDGGRARIVVGGSKTSTAATGKILEPMYSVPFVLGVNYNATVAHTGPFIDGRIYAYRHYDRALSDDEIIHNQWIDHYNYDTASPAASVTLDAGGTPATCDNIQVIDKNTIKCTTSAHTSGTVGLAMTNGAETATLANAFTYEAAYINLSVDGEVDFGGVPNDLLADYSTANVKTNNLSGYNLMIEASEPRLKCSSYATDYYIEPLSSAGPMADNKWGYAVGAVGVNDPPGSWRGPSNTPAVFDSYGGDTVAGRDTRLWFGTQVNYALPACAYSGTVTITAVIKDGL
jgi:hypothetical protein